MLCANKLGAFGLLLMDTMEGVLGDLSPTAAAFLLTLKYRCEMTATALGEISSVSQPTAVRVADGLIRRGLLERRDRSGRTAPLRLTSEGARCAGALQAARLRAMERLLAVLPDRERTAFERSLNKVLAAATNSRASARTTCRLCDHELCDGPLCPVGTRATELEVVEP